MFVRVRNWVADAAAGVKIRADYHDSEDDGFAAGLSNCICKDGQTAITQNIPMSGKRITGMADPVNAQDAATQAYADLKVAKTGDTMTGNLTIQSGSPILVLNAGGSGNSNNLFGEMNGKLRWLFRLGDGGAESGGNAGTNLDIHAYADDGSYIGYVLGANRANRQLTIGVDGTASNSIVSKGYIDGQVGTRLPTSGGTITGSLAVNGNFSVAGQGYVGGELIAAQGYIRFNSSGSGGYLQWNGGGTYTAGSGGTIYHTGNLNPVQDGRLANAGSPGLPMASGIYEPYGGAVITGLQRDIGTAGGPINAARWRYMQLLRPSGWYTVAYA
jgi:hypothetical protein